MKDSTVQKLAAYSTIKSMADSCKYKNQYYVLAEFIRYLISEFNLYSFSVLEMIEMLKEEFDFSIPFAVCKSSIRKINGLNRNGDVFTVISRENVSKDFEQINKNAAVDGKELIRKLNEFALKEKGANQGDNEKWIDYLEAEFIKYILDRQDAQELQYGDLISRFCIGIEEDSDLQKIIERIREGSILYSGLCYNIIETGSINSYMTLYLDTEILFYLAGYNGQLSQRIVLDLMNQIKKANKKEKKIELTYFYEVQEEIDRYFTAARNIVAGKSGVVTSRAMMAILNECENESDVLNKQSDFYYLLENSYGIRADKNADIYYSEENYKYNLESQDYLEEDDSKAEEAMRFISHINVLRKGQEFSDLMKSKYLIITETRKLIEASDKHKPLGKIGFALPTNSMTNILWLKLGGVFGTDTFPTNVSVAVKARMALGRSISASVNKVYTQTVLQYRDGVIQENQAVARLLRLQDKIIAPENINESNVDDLIDFSSESLQKYEEALLQEQFEIEKKDRLINELKNQKESRDETINELQIQNALNTATIKKQEDQLDDYRKKEEKAKKDKVAKEKDKLNRLKAFAGVVSAGILLCALGFLPEKSYGAKIIKGISGLVGIYSGICTIWPRANIFEKHKKDNHLGVIKNIDYKTSFIIWGLIDVGLLLIIILFIAYYKPWIYWGWLKQ